MKTLVERLRHGVGDAVRDHKLMQEAADRIEFLESENSRLRDKLRSSVRLP